MKKTISVILSLLILPGLLSVTSFAAGINNAGSTIDVIEENERLDANFGTVKENKGIIGANYNAVEKNEGTIDYQYSGTVKNYGGTVKNFYKDTVYNYGGIIEYVLSSDGTVFNYGGTVKNAYNGKVYNYGGTIENFDSNAAIIEFKKVTLNLSNANATGLTENNGEFWIAESNGKVVIEPIEGFRFESAPTVSSSSAVIFENEDGSYTISGITEDVTVTASAVSTQEDEKEKSPLLVFIEVLFMLFTLLARFLISL